MLTKPEIRDAHSYKIFMKNDLIQKGTSVLGLEEWKMMLFLIGFVKRDDEPHTPYTFRISEYCQICNKTSTSREYRGVNGYVFETLEKLRIHRLEIELTPKKHLRMGWISSALLDEDNDTVTVRFDANISQYIFFNLDTGKFTATVREIILPMKSTYGILMYLYLLSRKSLGRKQKISLEELRRRMGCMEKFEAYKDFRINVIEPALEDINTYSDIKISYEAVKTGRRVTDILFTYHGIPAEESIERVENCQQALDTLPKKR